MNEARLDYNALPNKIFELNRWLEEKEMETRINTYEHILNHVGRSMRESKSKKKLLLWFKQEIKYLKKLND